jgi:DNA-binding XRE family transcriptional regulator
MRERKHYAPREIVDALKDERIRQDMSQDQLADACDVARSTIANIERGYSYPSLPLLSKMAAVLGLKLQVVAEA